MAPSRRSSTGRARNPSTPSLPRGITARQPLNPGIAPPGNLKRILRERQEAGHRKACLPCRERKVRCSRGQPCQTCLKRGHADLCLYQESQSTPISTRAQQETTLFEHSSPVNMSDSLGNQATGVGYTADEAQGSEDPMPPPSLLGANSIIAMTRRDSVQPPAQTQRRAAFETGIFPLLGMDMNTQENRPPSTNVAAAERPTSSLPDDQEMIELFNFYGHRVHPFQFVVDDLTELEKIICSLMNEDTGTVGCDTHFLCLLHAILAAGAQFSDSSPSVRVPKVKRHLDCAFAFLGTFDYLSNPSKKLIRALLILGHVLQNNMNPRAAWILGGTTIRVALSLGLHQPRSIPETCRISPAEAQHLRLAIVWQDALLSLAFDRPPAAQEMDIGSDLPALRRRGQSETSLDYRQAMNWLCHLTLQHLPRHSNTASLDGIGGFFESFEALEHSLSPHLMHRHRCSSIQEIQEHYSLELHRNFTLSSLCRPILSRQVRRILGEEASSMILSKFQDALKRSVWALIRLRSITSHATRSWAFVHNGLSSALLLSFTKHIKDGGGISEIQAKLIQSLTEKDDNIGQFSVAHKQALKALQILQRLSEDAADGTVDNERRRAVSPTAAHHSLSFPDEPSATHENLFDFQDPSSLDMDEWLRTFDFDSFSPLDAYNLIMSDQAQASTGT